MPYGLGTEHEQEDPECGEDSSLDDGHGMQERADRGGGDHGRRQPTVEWHHGVLGKTKKEQGENDREKHRLFCHRRSWKDSALTELERSGHVIGQDDGGHEEHLGSTQKINDVLASASL